ncbi:unnamed protein product [Pipistrellus nathusii]|uniref:Uncharacterized protein n=1 Tax=Pipistrellus nathusii TaxID=59473 RepID=A0ABN9Z6D8_PIPNA
MHLYISTMSINSLENKNVNFKSLKYTVHFKTDCPRLRAHFTMDCGFGSLMASIHFRENRCDMNADLKFLISFLKNKLFLKHTIYKNSIYKVQQLVTNPSFNTLYIKVPGFSTLIKAEAIYILCIFVHTTP